MISIPTGGNIWQYKFPYAIVGLCVHVNVCTLQVKDRWDEEVEEQDKPAKPVKPDSPVQSAKGSPAKEGEMEKKTEEEEEEEEEDESSEESSESEEEEEEELTPYEKAKRRIEVRSTSQCIPVCSIL